MSPRLHLLPAAELAPWTEGLRALEASIRYPIADGADHFTIDHGDDYPAFFSGLGEAWFLIAEDGGQVVGSVAGVLGHGRLHTTAITTGYLADLKLARAYRGTGLARSMALKVLSILPTRRRFHSWQLGYFAAMRGDRGDVGRSFRGLHPGRLLRPTATLRLWFADPAQLRDLPDGPPTPPGPWLQLATNESAVVSTAGRKDLRIASTGQPWPLQHLCDGPDAWTPTWGAWLRRSAQTLADDQVACFGLDDRLEDHHRWLTSQGVESGAVCTVYTLHAPGRLRGVRYVHLPTSAI